MRIGYIVMEDGGNRYGPATTVLIAGAGGAATGECLIDHGRITGVTILTDDKLFTEAPAVTFFDPSGRGHGANATAVMEE